MPCQITHGFLFEGMFRLSARPSNHVMPGRERKSLNDHK
jgi:hypothetical protein